MMNAFEWTPVKERIFLVDMLIVPLGNAQTGAPELTRPRRKHVATFCGWDVGKRERNSMWHGLKIERENHVQRQTDQLPRRAQLTWRDDLYVRILLDQVVTIMLHQQRGRPAGMARIGQLIWDPTRLVVLFGARETDRDNLQLATVTSGTIYPDSDAIRRHFEQRRTEFARLYVAWRIYHRGDDRGGDRLDAQREANRRRLGLLSLDG